MATSLGLLDRTPPPFFRQGTSALTKLSLFSALAIFLMVADLRFKVTHPLRSVIATLLLPIERSLSVPVNGLGIGREYLLGLQDALTAQARARKELALLSERASRVEQLTLENDRLRALLELRPALVVKSQAAEILYEAADPFSRKVIIDRGKQQGVVAGSPVINETGVLGQVTRVYPLSSEVTLLTDKDAAIPVLNTRTQSRSAAFGGLGAIGGEGLELRFMAGNADVQVGDTLTTSGVDGVYPPGLAVATVSKVERVADSGFARISLKPLASSDAVRHVLVLEPIQNQLPARPVPLTDDPAPADPKEKGKKGGRP